MLYLRAASVHGDRAPFVTEGGFYRSVSEYLRAFQRRGYRPRFVETSLGVVAVRAALRAPGTLTPRAIGMMSAVVGRPLRVASAIGQRTDHYNYVFERLGAV